MLQSLWTRMKSAFIRALWGRECLNCGITLLPVEEKLGLCNICQGNFRKGIMRGSRSAANNPNTRVLP